MELLEQSERLGGQEPGGWMLCRLLKDTSQQSMSLQGERGERSAASLAAFVRLDPELQVADRVGLD